MGEPRSCAMLDPDITAKFIIICSIKLKDDQPQ
jgi:hypothetical protein